MKNPIAALARLALKQFFGTETSSPVSAFKLLIEDALAPILEAGANHQLSDAEFEQLSELLQSGNRKRLEKFFLHPKRYGQYVAQWYDFLYSHRNLFVKTDRETWEHLTKLQEESTILLSMIIQQSIMIDVTYCVEHLGIVPGENFKVRAGDSSSGIDKIPLSTTWMEPGDA